MHVYTKYVAGQCYFRNLSNNILGKCEYCSPNNICYYIRYAKKAYLFFTFSLKTNTFANT